MSGYRVPNSKISNAMDQLGRGLREGVSTYFSPVKAVASDMAKSIRDEAVRAKQAKADDAKKFCAD